MVGQRINRLTRGGGGHRLEMVFSYPNPMNEALHALLQAVADGKIAPSKAEEMIRGALSENLSTDQLDNISGAGTTWQMHTT